MRERDKDRATTGDDLATLEEARRATIPPERFKDEPDLWPGLEAALGRERSGRRSPVAPAWRWAFGTAALLAFIGFVVLVPSLTRRPPAPASSPDGGPAFRIDSVTIEEKPAQAFVFHTQNPDTTYVWVERQL